MRRRLITIGVVCLLFATILVFIDQLFRHFDDGAFPLRVNLVSNSDRRVKEVSAGVLLDEGQAELFRADPSVFPLDPVSWKPGALFEMRVVFGGEYSGFGRELQYGQARFLALGVEYADGGKEYLAAEIPNHRRYLAVEVP
jgi:hypothetical protein